MRSSRVFASILSCALAMVPVLPSAGQASPRPWVLVSVPATPEGETRSEILAEVIADTVELTLRLMGRYVLQSRPSVPVNPASDAEAASLSHELSLDYLVYGNVAEVDTTTTRFSLSVYSREQGAVVLSRDAVATSLFETFEVADALTAELLEAFTGQRIAYGSIELVNEAPLAGRYHVRVDGEPMGDTVSLLERVLVGPRELEIVGADGTRIQEQIVVEEGALHRVSFSLTAVEPPIDTGHLLTQPEPPAPENGAPELTVVTELPFAWRAYEWSRTDPGRREGPLWTTTFHLTREERPGWDSQGWGGGLITRMDWGRRHSLLLEYSRVSPNWLDPDEDGDQLELYADDVTAETVLTYRPQDVYRLATGYGVRLEPARGITIMPWWRVALERDARRAVYREESGAWLPVSFPENQERAPYVPEVPTGELFWNVVTGPALVVEGSLRRASLYVGGGVSRIIPLSQDYSAQVTVTPYDIDEGRFVPVVGTIDPEWGWHLSLGAGYSWGGNERTVNEAYSRMTGRPRPYESYPPERAPYGVSVAPSFGAPVIFAPQSNVGTLSFPSPALSLEYGRPGGRLLAITAFSAGGVGGRASRVLEQPVEGAEPFTINSDMRTPVMGVRLGIARRRAMSDRITMSLGYHLSPVFQTMGEEFRPLVEALGMAGIGPTVSVAHAPEGSRAIVFGSLVLHTPIPLGPTLYTAGLDEHDTEDRPGDTANRTVDGYTDRPPMAVASFGVRLRVAGTPARILAAPARARDSGSAGPAPPPDSELTAEHRRRWWQPVAVVGVGVALPVADNPAEGTLYSGLLTTVPLALRFPFGGELGLEGTFPLSRRGISAPEAPFPIVNTANQYGTFQIPMDAEPRLNRLTSVEVGYRLRRNLPLSLRPALRYTWADLELWAIESRLQDGTLLAPGEEHFTRVDPVHFLGASVEAAWAIRPALSLRATVSVSRRISAPSTEVTPPFAPTVEVTYPDSLVTFSIATMVEM